MKKKDFKLGFDRLLNLYLKGRLSARQKKEMEDLQESFQKERHENIDFTEDDEKRLLTSILARTSNEELKTRRFSISLVAATIGFVLLVASVVWYVQYVYSSDAGKVHLPDGSLVWVKSGEIHVSGNREVVFQGEALFEVASDPQHPFRIHAGRYTITVLGTSFHIRETGENLELTVLTGRVKITTENSDEEYDVGPNRKLLIRGKNTELSESTPPEIDKLTTNTDYPMEFNDSRMEEIITRVEQKFGCTIVTSDPGIRLCVISADFTDQSLTSTVAMISEALHVSYRIQGDTVMLEGAGCHQ